MEIIKLEKTFEEICKDKWLSIWSENRWLWKAFILYSWKILEVYVFLNRWNEKYLISQWFNSWIHLDDIYSDIPSAFNGLIMEHKNVIEEYKRYINSMVKLLSEKEIEIKKLLIKLDELWK